MEYFAGLDVSLETVNVCIVNAAGDILLEKKIAAEPAAIIHLLSVKVDFPVWVIEARDREASRLGVTRQALIKHWIAERVDRAA
jgi:hypothetical protein